MTISPGWYPDPAEPSTQRYWDGGGWIGAPIPAGAIPPATPAPLPPAPAPTAPVVLSPITTVKAAKGSELPAQPHGLPLATAGVRAVARLIDTAVLIGLNILVNGWFAYLWVKEFIPFYQQYTNRLFTGQSTDDIAKPERLDQLMFTMVVIAVALWFAYEVPSIAFRGQTLGKRITGIKVVAVESLEPLGFSRSWRRWNTLGLPMLLIPCLGPCFVFLQAADVVFILVDKVRRMALHDRSAGTYVVQLPKLQTERKLP